MADELIQAGIFEGMTWWNTNPSKNFFPTGGLSPSPYCSMAVGGEGLAATWAVGDHQIVNNINMGVLGSTGRSTVQRSSPSANFFDQDPHMMDSSTLQAMGFDAPAWNHQEDIMHGGSSEGDYNTATMLGDVNPNTIMQAGEWSTTFGDLNCTSSPPTAINSSGNSSGSTDGSTLTCDGKIPVVNSFPVDPSSLFPSSLLSGDFKSSDHEILPPCDWGTNATQVSPGSSFNQQEQIINHIRATLLGASPCSSLPSSPTPQSRKKITNPKVNKNEEDCDSASLDLRNAVEPMFKRQRIETPSSLPTFKVRKEKLGDRITALQQLVSPFGKTDTASVLHEAIEYIKFLHDQVHGLSTPYMKNGAPMQHPHQQQQGNHNPRSKSEGEVANQDLRSRGLCLVPISSTFPVAHETPADFWTPTFGATFR